MLTRREATAAIAATAAVAFAGGGARAADAVALPAPKKEGGMPLLGALAKRRSMRQYADKPLDLETLSDLLWAANGVNRPSGDRTAPYWRHLMVTDIYVAAADGVFLFDPAAHALIPQSSSDIRAATGSQDFVGHAALDLVYVAHGERMTDVSPEERRLYASVDVGFIGQNVYLFCASEGLASVFRGSVDKEKVAKLLNLGEGQFVTFSQTVGYPA